MTMRLSNLILFSQGLIEAYTKERHIQKVLQNSCTFQKMYTNNLSCVWYKAYKASPQNDVRKKSPEEEKMYLKEVQPKVVEDKKEKYLKEEK